MEQPHLIYLYFSKNLKFEQLLSCAKLVLKNQSLAVSKVGAYCIVSGRIRYTNVLTNYSRHVFFERTAQAYNTGFYMASW